VKAREIKAQRRFNAWAVADLRLFFAGVSCDGDDGCARKWRAFRRAAIDDAARRRAENPRQRRVSALRQAYARRRRT
jgi:hypothetical protein